MLIARLNKLERERRLQRADSFVMLPRLLLLTSVLAAKCWTLANNRGPGAAHAWTDGAAAAAG